MSKRVAIIGTRGYPSYYGGFETAIRKLAPHLADAGWDVAVYGRSKSIRPDDPLLDRRVRSVLTPGVDSKSLSTLSYGLSAVLHAFWFKPDVALIMNVANGYWLPLLKLRGVPTVVNVDGIEWDRDKWGKAAKAVFKGGAWMTARFASRLITDSKVIQERWRREFNRSSAFIPYGGDVNGDVAVQPGLRSGGYVLLVARFVPENTITEFFDAVELLKGEFPVVIVGSSGYGSELDDRAKKLSERFEQVTWLGHVSDDLKLASLWQHAGVYFHGHSVGGTNPALVQAMASGAPVLARDTEYNREVLLDAAHFVLPKPSDIAAGLRLLLSDESRRHALQTAGINRALSHYTWEAVCESYSAELLALTAVEE